MTLKTFTPVSFKLELGFSQKQLHIDLIYTFTSTVINLQPAQQRETAIMIKEYFTDGLIGIAIVLSLFRMDLVGINNLINYPEVQDIILGQTAAYLPANFHHIHSSLRTYGNPKHLDFDNTAFNAWFQNVNNLPLFRENRAYDIEAFLVSASQENVDGEQYPSDQTVSAFSESNTVPRNSLSSLPLESAISFTGEALVSIVPHSSHLTSVNEEPTAEESNTDVNQKDSIDSWFSNGTFPGSNLTKEVINLMLTPSKIAIDLVFNGTVVTV